MQCAYKGYTNYVSNVFANETHKVRDVLTTRLRLHIEYVMCSQKLHTIRGVLTKATQST